MDESKAANEVDSRAQDASDASSDRRNTASESVSSSARTVESGPVSGPGNSMDELPVETSIGDVKTPTGETRPVNDSIDGSDNLSTDRPNDKRSEEPTVGDLITFDDEFSEKVIAATDSADLPSESAVLGQSRLDQSRDDSKEPSSKSQVEPSAADSSVSLATDSPANTATDSATKPALASGIAEPVTDSAAKLATPSTEPSTPMDSAQDENSRREQARLERERRLAKIKKHGAQRLGRIVSTVSPSARTSTNDEVKSHNDEPEFSGEQHQLSDNQQRSQPDQHELNERGSDEGSLPLSQSDFDLLDDSSEQSDFFRQIQDFAQSGSSGNKASRSDQMQFLQQIFSNNAPALNILEQMRAFDKSNEPGTAGTEDITNDIDADMPLEAAESKAEQAVPSGKKQQLQRKPQLQPHEMVQRQRELRQTLVFTVLHIVASVVSALMIPLFKDKYDGYSSWLSFFIAVELALQTVHHFFDIRTSGGFIVHLSEYLPNRFSSKIATAAKYHAIIARIRLDISFVLLTIGVISMFANGR